MKILITGGAGFIGSHLAGELLKKGHEVYAIDDLSTGSIENLDHLQQNKKFHYIIDSIFNESVLRELVDKCDLIFHHAAAVGVELIIQSPVRTIETNIYGTEMVLKYANLKKKKVIITSTSEVYGKSTKIPFSENDDLVIGPTNMGRWSYACSKAIDEFLAIAYWKEKKLPVIIVRLFNTVGPRQTGKYGMVVPRFIKCALANEPITIYGSGKQSRCFTYISDVVSGLIALSEEPKAVGEVFNIGNPDEITIEELALKIKKMTNSRSKLKYIPYVKAYGEGFEDMMRRIPDIRKIHKYVGYSPKVSIDEILKRTISWTKENN